MYCKHCGVQLSEDARFCSSCGTALGHTGAAVENSEAAPESVASNSAGAVYASPQQGSRRRPALIALIAGLAIIVIATAGVLITRGQGWFRERSAAGLAASTEPTPPEPATSPASKEATMIPVAATTMSSDAGSTPAGSGGFAWSGLSPDEVTAARGALDEAIAHEEQMASQSAGGVRHQ